MCVWLVRDLKYDVVHSYNFDNLQTEEERTAIREKLKNMGPATRGKLRKDPRMRDRTPHADLSNTDFDHKAMRADTKAFMETIKDVTDSEERKQLLRAHKVEVMAKLRGNRI